MKSKKTEVDIPHTFWANYEKADMLERDKLLKPILKNVLSITEIKDKKFQEQSLKTSLKGYFDDLFDYFYSKK